jgi:hypothetical protein
MLHKKKSIKKQQTKRIPKAEEPPLPPVEPIDLGDDKNGIPKEKVVWWKSWFQRGM